MAKTKTSAKSTARKTVSVATHTKTLKQVDELQGQITSLQGLLSNSVSKEILRNETLLERLNWWFKDLSGKWKTIVRVVAIVIVVGAAAALYITTGTFITDPEYAEYLQIAIAIITMVFGGTAGAGALKTPKQTGGSTSEGEVPDNSEATGPGETVSSSDTSESVTLEEAKKANEA